MKFLEAVRPRGLEQGYLVALKITTILALLTPLVFSVRTSYSAILSQSTYFRFIVEGMLVLYGLLLMRNRVYRPHLTPITLGVLAFFASMTVSSIFGFNPARSFWGTLGRGEGLLLHLHLFAFFLMLTGIVRRRDEWVWLLRTLVAVSIPIGVFGTLQYYGYATFSSLDCMPLRCFRIHGTLSNAGYYGSYLTLIIIVAIFLTTIEKRAWVRILLAILAVWNIGLLMLTGARASWLGLIVALLFIGISWMRSWPTDARKKRLALLCFMLLFCAGFLTAVLARQAGYVQNSHILDRLEGIFSNIIDLEHSSRLQAWRIGIGSWQEHPWLGSGLESLSYYYDRYPDPAVLQLFGKSQILDRAHNHLIDIAASRGILGILVYLFLIASVVQAILRSKTMVGPHGVLLLIGFIVAHEVQYLFTFPVIATYVVLFLMLAFFSSGLDTPTPLQRVAGDSWPWYGQVFGALVLGFGIALVSLATVVLPLRADLRFVQSIHLLDAGQLKSALETWKSAQTGLPEVRQFEMQLFFANELNHFRRALPASHDNQKRFALIQAEQDILAPALARHLTQGRPDISPLYAHLVLRDIYQEQYAYGNPPDQNFLNAAARITEYARLINPHYPF